MLKNFTPNTLYTLGLGLLLFICTLTILGFVVIDTWLRKRKLKRDLGAQLQGNYHD